MYSIFKQHYLNNIEKAYETILMIETPNIPDDLKNIVIPIRLEKISYHRPDKSCGYAFKSFSPDHKYLQYFELPQLVSLLTQYNYTCDYEMNKILVANMDKNFVMSFHKS